ncbi:hypothetical protein EPN87_03455 [archaeon]|nr:MAG: hypothetical protein EPN87_03455 [archaeon]
MNLDGISKLLGLDLAVPPKLVIVDGLSRENSKQVRQIVDTATKGVSLYCCDPGESIYDLPNIRGRQPRKSGIKTYEELQEQFYQLAESARTKLDITSPRFVLHQTWVSEDVEYSGMALKNHIPGEYVIDAVRGNIKSGDFSPDYTLNIPIFDNQRMFISEKLGGGVPTLIPHSDAIGILNDLDQLDSPQGYNEIVLEFVFHKAYGKFYKDLYLVKM